jgi:hypothetical protein
MLYRFSGYYKLIPNNEVLYSPAELLLFINTDECYFARNNELIPVQVGGPYNSYETLQDVLTPEFLDWASDAPIKRFELIRDICYSKLSPDAVARLLQGHAKLWDIDANCPITKPTQIDRLIAFSIGG